MTRNRTRTGTRLLVAVVLGASAITVGACGGDGGGNKDDGNAATTPAAATTPSVDIEDFSFSPDSLKVKVGTTVTFTNHDGFDHTVTAKDKSFDSGHLAKDATFERTFDAPGTYAYLCAIHNSMTGSVVVS